MIVTKAEAKELYNKLKKTENLGETWRRSYTDWVIELRDEDNPKMLARSVYCSPSYEVPGHALIQSWVFLRTGAYDHATMGEDRDNSKRAALLLVNDKEGYALCAHTAGTGELRFSAGCRNFSLGEALSHWTHETYRPDYLGAIFEYVGCMGTKEEREEAKEWIKRYFGNSGSDMKEAYKRGVALRKEGLTC